MIKPDIGIDMIAIYAQKIELMSKIRMKEKVKSKSRENEMTVANAAFEALPVNSASRSSSELNSGRISSFNIIRPSGRLFLYLYC